MSVQLDNTNVSKVLGKTVDYPDQYDSSILVREPRKSNRQHLKIRDDDLPFVGADVWNAYEVSCLTKKGLPVVAIAKIVYPASNSYIVESKSIKLYLNSFNMTRLGNTVEEALSIIGEKISADLSNLLETNVAVGLFTPTEAREHSTKYIFDPKQYITLEDQPNVVDNNEFEHYTESPSLLAAGDNPNDIKQYYHSSLLKSNCRVTGQPDWGDVYIYMDSDSMLSPKHLLRYIVSFRDENHFHEEICETIYKRLYTLYRPRQLAVTCLYARRGGIDINPTRVSDVDLLNMDLIDPQIVFTKTPRQ
tara:strand:+ start:390 stop:1304 length:915 start_codon:yes stop_codon:yes gene_type:complete